MSLRGYTTQVSWAKYITTFNDADGFDSDPYVHLASSWIMGSQYSRPVSDEEHWIYPSFARKGPNFGKLINQRIKKYHPSNGNESYSLTSLRDGAISWIMEHRALDGPKYAVARSGHDHTNVCSVFDVCSVFEYYYASAYMEKCAGRALANWPDHIVKHGRVPVPDISILYEKVDEQLFE